MALGQYFAIPIKAICDAISNYRPTNMRSQRQQTDRNVLTIDAYNANPSSMRESILSQLSKEQENLVFIIGDMLELGSDATDYHQAILDLIDSNKAQVITVGPIFNSCNNKVESCFDNVGALIESGLLQSLKGQEILIKGSRGIKLEKVISLL